MFSNNAKLIPYGNGRLYGDEIDSKSLVVELERRLEMLKAGVG